VVAVSRQGVGLSRVSVVNVSRTSAVGRSSRSSRSSLVECRVRLDDTVMAQVDRGLRMVLQL